MEKKKKPVKKQPKADINIHIEGNQSWINGIKQKMFFWHGEYPLKHCDSVGPALAVVLSYTRNHSILLAIVHGILSWLYVIYRGLQVLGWI